VRFVWISFVACGSRTPLDVLFNDAAAPSPIADATADVRDASSDATADADALVDSEIDSSVQIHGCSDGSREAFRDAVEFPLIAGCAGGFEIPGILPTRPPDCARAAGNNGANPKGAGCNVSDLCEAGWHVCHGASEVAARIGSAACAGDAKSGEFYATEQSGPGCTYCATGNDPTCGQESCRAGCAQTSNTTNDFFGCGTAGDPPNAASCGVLNRFSQNLCGALPTPWFCGNSNGDNEILVVVKPGPGAGGVLCCKN